MDQEWGAVEGDLDGIVNEVTQYNYQKLMESMGKGGRLVGKGLVPLGM